jgi:hypothetical protein
MKRHATDMVSLVFGFLFLAIAAWWAVVRYINIDIDVPNLGWIAAAALIALGLIGVAASLRGDRTGPAVLDEPTDEWPTDPTPTDAPTPAGSRPVGGTTESTLDIGVTRDDPDR